MATRWKHTLLRSALLFLISVVLVAGFWFHAEFYQIGLYPLLAIGGFVTFLVIVAVRWILSGVFLGPRAREKIVVSPAEAEAIARRPETAVVFPATRELPLLGATVRIVTEAGAAFGTVRVGDSHRTLLGDLTLEDLRRAGYADRASFQRAWEAARSWRPEEPVTVLRLARLGGTAT